MEFRKFAEKDTSGMDGLMVYHLDAVEILGLFGPCA